MLYNEDSLQQYLKEIAAIPLLTKEEEDMAFFEGNKELLVKSNLKLVVSIAKSYRNQDIPFQDLIQEGTIGLIKAIEKFDPSMGYKLSTYATWWVKQAINRAIANKGRAVRLPVHLIERMSKVKRAQRELEQILDREPTPIEIAKRAKMTEEKVVEILKLSSPITSLETPIGEEDTLLVDLVPDNCPSIYEQTEHSILKSQVQKVLMVLTDREKQVVVMRFGLDGNQPKTLELIGLELGLSRERIRQLENRALRKLRQPSKQANLEIYLG